MLIINNKQSRIITVISIFFSKIRNILTKIQSVAFLHQFYTEIFLILAI